MAWPLLADNNTMESLLEMLLESTINPRLEADLQYKSILLEVEKYRLIIPPGFMKFLLFNVLWGPSGPSIYHKKFLL